MTREQWQRLESLFDRAHELPAAERQQWLERECAGDLELQREVESLLASSASDSRTLTAAVGNAAAVWAARESSDHLKIGHWRITGILGEGGMGIVYSAVRDDDEYQQRVAIKLIRGGGDSAELDARFRRERQILATLSHPNIAQLFDGGATPDGHPYLVMELVEGKPLTDYCRLPKLDVRQRLELFRTVCAAVQYAHQQLVVHRDLKPGNILVTESGGVKLLDFGIAKLLEQDNAGRTVTGAGMLTPGYASPEQVRGEPVSTLSDVYSLGAILYELLSGERAHRLKGASPAEIAAAVCSNPIAPPSVAAAASAEPACPARQLKGDLDNIVLKAMHREKEQRYGSAEQLSEDIRRYLTGMPVMARPDTVWYRTTRFAARHRLALAAAAVIVAALGAMGGVTIYQGQRAQRRFTQVRRLANTFLFDFHDKIAYLQGATEARELVVRTALQYLDSLAGEAGGDPGLRLELAQAYVKVGDVQGNPRLPNLGHPDAAVESYRRAQDLGRQLYQTDPRNLEVMRALATAEVRMGDIQYQLLSDARNGLAVLRAGLDLQRKILENPQATELDHGNFVTASNLLGDALIDDEPEAAGKAYGESIRIARSLAQRWPREESQRVLVITLERVGRLAHAQGDPEGCIKAYAEAETVATDLVRRFPANARYRRELSTIDSWLGNAWGGPEYFNLGDSRRALEYYNRANDVAREMVKNDPNDSQAVLDLAIGVEKVADVIVSSDPAQAIRYANECLAGATAALKSRGANGHTALRVQCMASLANAEAAAGNHARALQIRDEVHALNEERRRKTPSDLGVQETRLLLFASRGASLAALRQWNRAETEFAAALEAAESLATQYPKDPYFLRDLAQVCEDIARFRAAQARAGVDRARNLSLARKFASRAEQSWQKWPQIAVTSAFDQTNLKRVAALARSLQ
jgi:tetratricopeptide (TPR) repeat protein